MTARAKLLPPLLLGLVAEALFLFRLATPHKLVFDETHYVPAARTLWSLDHAANIEHPLLGKTLIGLGIWLFGDNSFGWRALSTVAATAVVVGIYAIGWFLWRERRPALFAAVLVLINFTVFVQARIAMLDGFMAGFVVTALAAFAWGARRGGWAPWLLGSALLGLAIGCKWTAVPYLGFVALALVIVRLVDAWRAGRPVSSMLGGGDQPHWPGLPTVPALAALGLVAFPVYLLTFAPAFFYHWDPLTWSTLLPFQATMYAEQTQVLPPHTYQSSWWTWAPMIRPIWYLYEPADGAQRGILLIGNPAVMWGGLVAVALCLWGAWRDRSLALASVAGLWLASYLMWGIIPKSLGFFYYYYLSSIFLPLAIAAAFRRFGVERWAGWDEPFLIFALGLFLFFYPILAATPLSRPDAFTRWTWFKSWV